MLEILQVSAGYGGRAVVENVTFSVPAGEVTALIGPNGCGKSTLLKALCGILTPMEGKMRWQGQDILSVPQKQRARTVAYLSQGRQVPDITAGRLVLHGRFPYLQYPRHYSRADLALAREAMDQMGVLELENVPLAQMSGGQRQKVYIAMALAQDTPVLLLDEPTTYLDIANQLQLLEQARRMAAAGKAVLMVVHDIAAAMAAADRILLMDRGRVCFRGTPEQLYESGMIRQVFGVDLRKMDTPEGVRYYCQA